LRRTSFVIFSLLIMPFFLARPSVAQNVNRAADLPDDGVALTPPMGWYPWNEFGQEPQNQKLIEEIAAALVTSGMKEAGYQYVGPDEGICFSRDSSGKLTSNLERYPSGLRGLGDLIHKQGLKYALYTDAGTHTCSKAMPGTKDHEFDDMQAFANWRADYIKVDWCNTEGQDVAQSYTKLRDALRAAGRPIVFSLCSWGEGEPWKWAASVGNLWRTTGDICGPGKADWANAMKITAANEKLYTAARPGHWNDPDMMISGMNGLSETQNRSFFSLWCMMAAPLMAGNDLRRMTPSTVRILTNPEAIGINQDPLGIQGRIVRREGEIEIWAGKPLFDGSQAVLVFNPGAAPAELRLAWTDLGLEESASLYVHDLWTHQTTGPRQRGISLSLAPTDAALLRLSRSSAFPLPPILVADSYLLSFRAAGPASQKLTGVLTVKTNGSDVLPPWKVQPGLPAWLSVAVRRNGKSQTFTNTVSTAGLAKGSYHALVRADNLEPRSGKPTSSLYYDVDLEVSR
jgi:alpha-galactosidase